MKAVSSSVQIQREMLLNTSRMMIIQTVYLCCALHVRCQMERCSLDLHVWKLVCCVLASTQCLLRGFGVLRSKQLT